MVTKLLSKCLEKAMSANSSFKPNFRIFWVVLFSVLLQAQVGFSQLIPHLNIIQEKAPFPGYLYRPNDNLPHPAILLLHGSEGGNGDYWYFPGQKPTKVGADALVPFVARYYATLGYVTYALCYFDCEHLPGYSSYPPQELKNIDLMSVTYPALEWLKNSKFVQNNKVILWGASRGAEQTLVLASELSKLKINNPNIILPDGVVALSPLERIAPAFPYSDAQALISGSRPQFSRSDSAWMIYNRGLKTFEGIALNEYPNPVLVSSFVQDPVWGRIDMSQLVKQYSADESYFVNTDFSPSCQSYLGQTTSEFKRFNFLEFSGSGHVFPDYGTHESGLLDQKIQRFFKFSSQ